jgi:hypothetical protein
MFEPDKEITRQEMAALLYNTLKAVDKLQQNVYENQYSSFSCAWYKFRTFLNKIINL